MAESWELTEPQQVAEDFDDDDYGYHDDDEEQWEGGC